MTHEQNSAGSLNRKRRPAPNVTGEAGVISEVRDDLRALEAVVEGTARGTGQGFFRSLVRHLAEAIDVHYAVVAEFPKAPPHVRTLAFWERDRVGSNFEYDFTGTPCAEIVRGGLVHYPTGVSQLTPQATPLVERGIDSYMAVPFLDHAGGILGHLAVFDERPMPAEPRREFVFRIFAARASAEQERLQAEQRLRESEARYRHLFENAPIGYITVGTDLRILNVNRRMTEMLGYPVEELVGAVIHSFLPDTTAGKARSEEVHRRHVAGASVSGWELEMRRKDGRPLWIKLWMEGGRGEDGAILPARAIVLDITDRVGSIRNMVDYAGNLMNTVTYDGFGGIVSETGDGDRWKWTGRELDGETGLQYNRARYYDSRIGRWTSEDPIGFGSGDANLFAYSSNAPTRFTDPTGLMTAGGVDGYKKGGGPPGNNGTVFSGPGRLELPKGGHIFISPHTADWDGLALWWYKPSGMPRTPGITSWQAIVGALQGAPAGSVGGIVISGHGSDTGGVSAGKSRRPIDANTLTEDQAAALTGALAEDAPVIILACGAGQHDLQPLADKLNRPVIANTGTVNQGNNGNGNWVVWRPKPRGRDSE
jgi:RHS repeat-associated protein/PAS domain S-box-containing protein